ncbi:hypothetical protein [Moritella dasanensis]|uniref:hypothetical protein n=1 Tax=Moritella dasanensis TaxID=428031 RepID=UPI0002DF9FB8|nr:hypothetical protein [Moritella dasanensis]
MKMKIKLLVSLFAVALAPPVFADKPEWAGNGKPTSEQKEAHKSAMQAKDDEQESTKIKKDKKDKEDRIEKVKGSEKQKEVMQIKDDEQKSTNIKKEKKDREDKVKGIEKQKDKKLSQEQASLDKDSLKGKNASETGKKWWKFWGE